MERSNRQRDVVVKELGAVTARTKGAVIGLQPDTSGGKKASMGLTDD